jgi:hypothetical protein
MTHPPLTTAIEVEGSIYDLLRFVSASISLVLASPLAKMPLRQPGVRLSFALNYENGDLVKSDAYDFESVPYL